MKKTEIKTVKVTGDDQRSALASPLRLEIIGLFTSPEPLAIADMAKLMGRTAGSLYHHVGILEKAGFLTRAGTRPKGKRYEALFQPTGRRIEMDPQSGGQEAMDLAVKTMASAFRMTERDLETALNSGNYETEGPERTLLATRLHMRLSPKILARVNKHLDAIVELLTTESARSPRLSAADKHLSLTIALLPLKGRSQDESE